MRISVIRAFLLAHRHRSVTAASQALNVTQSALSKMLQNLESDLGVSLFQRSIRGLTPTRHAAIFLPHAERILDEYVTARRTLHAAAARPEAIRVGADPYVVRELLPNAVAHLLAQNPHVSIEISTGIGDGLIEAAARGEMDLCVTSVSRKAPLHLLATTYLFHEDYAVVARERHPLAARRSVRLAELVHFPWVHVGVDFRASSNLVPLLRARRVKLPEAFVEADSLAYAVAHLRRTNCLSFQPARLADMAGLCRIPVAGLIPPPVFRVVAGHPHGEPISPAAEKLLDHLRQCLRDSGVAAFSAQD